MRRAVREVFGSPSPTEDAGGWGERTVGSVDGNDVTFRQGYGKNDGHTLIGDGQLSSRGFKRAHNHYGTKREGGGSFDEDRGFYTGPGH